MPISDQYKAAPIFQTLGEDFGDIVTVADFPQTILRYKNDTQAATVGLDKLSDAEWIKHFGRFEPLPDNLPNPIAQRYHGHQFRQYNPDIGDGRGFLFAQLKDTQARTLDLGTKGSGTTPHSRAGDGRLTLKGGVREIMATEMLEALGVNTSKTFSLIETGEALERGDEPSPTRSAVMVRLSHGHIRIGSFQRLAYLSQTDNIQKLVDYCLTHYFNEDIKASGADRCLQFLELVCRRTATLTAETLAAGFIHGVLNSDNINITGESFDYGPWRFLDRLDPNHTAAYFDRTGLYSYGRQGEAILWDTYQLAGTLIEICDEADVRKILDGWEGHLHHEMRRTHMAKLGLKETSAAADDDFLNQILKFLVENDIPFEQFFFDWFCGAKSEPRAKASPFSHFYAQDNFTDIKAQLMARAPDRPERLDHEYFTLDSPCTMLIDEVEALWSHIDERDDWQPLYKKLQDITLMKGALQPRHG